MGTSSTTYCSLNMRTTRRCITQHLAKASVADVCILVGCLSLLLRHPFIGINGWGNLLLLLPVHIYIYLPLVAVCIYTRIYLFGSRCFVKTVWSHGPLHRFALQPRINFSSLCPARLARRPNTDQMIRTGLHIGVTNTHAVDLRRQLHM